MVADGQIGDNFGCENLVERLIFSCLLIQNGRRAGVHITHFAEVNIAKHRSEFVVFIIDGKRHLFRRISDFETAFVLAVEVGSDQIVANQNRRCLDKGRVGSEGKRVKMDRIVAVRNSCPMPYVCCFSNFLKKSTLTACCAWDRSSKLQRFFFVKALLLKKLR